jgi:hypothetical protein
MSKSRGGGNKTAQSWETAIIVLLLIFIGLQVYKLIMKSNVASSSSPTVVPTGMPATDAPTSAPTPVSDEPYYYNPTPPVGSPALLAKAIAQL